MYLFLIIKEEQNFWPNSKQNALGFLFCFVLSASGGIGMIFGSSFEKLLLASMKGKVIIVCFTFVTVWLAGRDLMLSFYNWEKLSNLFQITQLVVSRARIGGQFCPHFSPTTVSFLAHWHGDDLSCFFCTLVLSKSHVRCKGKKWKSLSRVQQFVTAWTIQSMEFSRPEYWSG